MTNSAIPVVFNPLFKPKPWGGRRLATLLGKHLPPNELIGESWELVSLPGNESRVRDGPVVGSTISELIDAWGEDLTGDVVLVEDRFPLMIKYLDARENLSVQVHPKPSAKDPAGLQLGSKFEAWYVIHAEPGAQLYVGLNPGVGPDDLARAANTPAIAGLLRAWNARPGDCFYLPSGVVHALGAGIVVAEIQTPSDVTYRLYDWDRVDSAGRSRTLHIKQALANARYDVSDDEIVQPRDRIPNGRPGVVHLARCEHFAIDATKRPRGQTYDICSRAVHVWIVLRGTGCVTVADCYEAHGLFGPGDVILVPASDETLGLDLDCEGEWLEVLIPSTHS